MKGTFYRGVQHDAHVEERQICGGGGGVCVEGSGAKQPGKRSAAQQWGAPRIHHNAHRILRGQHTTVQHGARSAAQHSVSYLHRDAQRDLGGQQRLGEHAVAHAAVLLVQPVVALGAAEGRDLQGGG